VIDLDLLLDYHYWARDRMFDALERLSPEEYVADRRNSFRSIRDTVVHLYSAEWSWHSRWRGHSPSAHLSPEDFPDVAAVRSAWRELEPQVRTLVGGLGPVERERVFDYLALNGTPQQSVFWHMVQHVVNHATYHRGQITTMLRQAGAEPPKSMDLITFYREGGASHVRRDGSRTPGVPDHSGHVVS
jgi:uncharacterized damage-inducible protein DinB